MLSRLILHFVQSKLWLVVQAITSCTILLLILMAATGIIKATDSQTDAWILTAPLPNPLADAQTVADGETLYTIGGKTVVGSVPNIVSATLSGDGVLPIWQTLTSSLPISPYLHTVVKINKTIFSIGGYDDKQRFSTVYSASVESDTLSDWAAVNDLPVKLVLHSATVLDDCIFVIGGLTENNSPLQSVFHASLTGSNLSYWVQDPQSLPETRFRASASAYPYPADSLKGFLFLTGGFDGKNTSRKVFMSKVFSDCSLEKWQTVRDLPKPLHYHASVIYGDRLFVLGGKNESRESQNVYSTAIDREGKLGQWQQEGDLPLTLYRFGTAIIPFPLSCPTYLYVLGGLHGQIYQSQVYRTPLTICYKSYLPLVERNP